MLVGALLVLGSVFLVLVNVLLGLLGALLEIDRACRVSQIGKVCFLCHL